MLIVDHKVTERPRTCICSVLYVYLPVFALWSDDIVFAHSDTHTHFKEIKYDTKHTSITILDIKVSVKIPASNTHRNIFYILNYARPLTLTEIYNP